MGVLSDFLSLNVSHKIFSDCSVIKYCGAQKFYDKVLVGAEAL